MKGRKEKRRDAISSFVVAFAFSSGWTRAVCDTNNYNFLNIYILVDLCIDFQEDITVLFCLNQPVSDLQQSFSKLITKYYDNIQFIITVKVIITDSHFLWTLCTCFRLFSSLLFRALE